MKTGDLFLRTGVIAGMAGMTLGIAMGVSNDFTLRSVHAHVNLLGWASLFLFGLFYRAVPHADGAVARWHFGLAVAGLITLTAGVAAIATGEMALAALAKVGSVLSIIGMVLFAYNVFRATASGPRLVPAIEMAEGARSQAQKIVREAAR